jgi:hypothetical protein
MVDGKASKKDWFSRIAGAIRAAGAGTTLWHFLTSQAAAVYVWGPLATVWVLVAGVFREIPTSYLVPAAVVTFGGMVWCFTESARALDRFRERYQKIAVVYDRSVPSCRADVTFVDGSHSICFRLKVENATTRLLHGCEGWLESTDRFPNLSPVRLFWVGVPEADYSVDLIKDVPRFLQICRISSDNRIHMATQGELWPIDSMGFPPGDYVFRVAIKGEDNAETRFYAVKLMWTGNWVTAEMAAAPIDKT